MNLARVVFISFAKDTVKEPALPWGNTTNSQGSRTTVDLRFESRSASLCLFVCVNVCPFDEKSKSIALGQVGLV